MSWRALARKRKGVSIGVTAALVFIAALVIAAAVVANFLNVGFLSAQKARDVGLRGMAEASSALQIEGSVLGITDSNAEVKYLVIPVRVSAGRHEVDISASTMVVELSITGESPLPNIYTGINHTASPLLKNSTLQQIISYIWPTDPSTAQAVFVINNDDNDRVLDYFEKGYLIVNLGNQTGNAASGFYRGEDYDVVKVEVKAIEGAPLSIERTLPGGLPVRDVVDLG